MSASTDYSGTSLQIPAGMTAQSDGHVGTCIDFSTFGGDFASLPEISDFNTVTFDGSNPTKKAKDGNEGSAGYVDC